MSKDELKKRPEHVPEENIYMGAHWTIYVSFLVALASLFLLINEGMFGG
jgi:hypothetical protein